MRSSTLPMLLNCFYTVASINSLLIEDSMMFIHLTYLKMQIVAAAQFFKILRQAFRKSPSRG